MKENTAVKEKETRKEMPKEEQKSVITPTKQEGHPYPFHLLQRDMNQLFEDFARGVEMWRPRFVEPLFGDFQIRVDVKNNEKEIVFTAEIPGVEQKDLEVSLTADTLIIRGEKKEEKEHSEKGYYRSERSYGTFQRIMPLPCEVEKDKVEATYTHGVLKIVMPKSKESLKDIKKVDIKQG